MELSYGNTECLKGGQGGAGIEMKLVAEDGVGVFAEATRRNFRMVSGNQLKLIT